jgi:hypothetical protein
VIGLARPVDPEGALALRKVTATIDPVARRTEQMAL